MKLTPAERAILVELLENGHDLSSNIADNAEVSPDHCNELLNRLEDRQLVKNKGRGVYRLTLEGVAAAQALRSD